MNFGTVEKMLLLAKHPAKGGFLTTDLHLNYGVIGSLLQDMLLEKIFEIQNDRIVPKGLKHHENPIYSEIETKIRSSEKPRKIHYWVAKLAKKSKSYKWMILNELASKRVVRIEQKKFLSIIPYRRCYLVDIKNRNNLIMQLKIKALSKKTLDEESKVLLSFIEVCSLRKVLSTDRSEQRILRNELRMMVKENPIARAVETVIKQTMVVVT
jgi:hypothetical protein